MIRGLGIDLIEIERIKQVGIERLAKRILTQREQAEISSSRRQHEKVAGKFVAKEAISKALGCGIGKAFSFYDAEILNDSQGKPHVTLSPSVIEHFFANQLVQIHLSITHTKGMASAVAIIEELV